MFFATLPRDFGPWFSRKSHDRAICFDIASEVVNFGIVCRTHDTVQDPRDHKELDVGKLSAMGSYSAISWPSLPRLELIIFHTLKKCQARRIT